MKISGDDRLAFKGQSVLYECQAAGWFPEPTMQWRVNDKQVTAVSHAHHYYLNLGLITCDIYQQK